MTPIIQVERPCFIKGFCLQSDPTSWREEKFRFGVNIYDGQPVEQRVQWQPEPSVSQQNVEHFNHMLLVRESLGSILGCQHLSLEKAGGMERSLGGTSTAGREPPAGCVRSFLNSTQWGGEHCFLFPWTHCLSDYLLLIMIAANTQILIPVCWASRED